MKQIFVTISLATTVVFFTTQCSTQSKQQNENTTEAATPVAVHSDDADFTKGEGIVLGSDCATCHKPDLRVSGPSYVEIADKYAADPTKISMLAGKIIKGGKGVWGETAMTAHPNMSQQDAEAAVKYIYYFKTK